MLDDTPWTKDPRALEYCRAANAFETGLNAGAGAHERYRASLLPYVECMAEMTPAEPPFVRSAMMLALFKSGLPLGVIAAGYRATEAELELVRNLPEIEPEPVDEAERLSRLPYGVYLKTVHWQRVRADALKRAGNRCALCNTSQGLEVHHRTYENRGMERPADVIALCGRCHGRHHGKLRAA